MSRIVWDEVGKHLYETGVDHGVLYPQVNGAYPKGVAWDGLISVSESPSGAEDTALYADNIKYLNLKSAEEFGATLTCYHYPDEWEKCDGSENIAEGVSIGQQARQNFGVSYRTKIGNDTEGDAHGYKIHMIYNCSATPSERTYSSTNDSPDAIEFSYEIATTPVPVEGYRPTAYVIVDSTKADPEKLKALEDILYGTDGEEGTATESRLPLPAEIMTLFAAG